MDTRETIRKVMGSIEQMAGVAVPRHAHAELFERQREAFAGAPFPAAGVRRERLRRLERLVREGIEPIVAAIRDDFGHRSAHETRLLEIFPTLEAIRHNRRNVAQWMRQERRAVSRWFLPARARVMAQPLGVVGIMVPWNYPVLLSLSPAAAALAAGNRAMIKTSEYTPRTSALLAVLVAKHFEPTELAVVEGDASVGQSFAGLPFDHLLFTGSTGVGRAVMRAAAENLTPVTLELGGKSPAIVGPGAGLEKAAERIVIGKCANAGQTCIAPDYVLLPEGSAERFVDLLRARVDRFYPAMAHTPDYSSIASARHYARLQAYVDEARERGARVESLSSSLPGADATRRRFPPLAVLDAPEDIAVMQEEIFGPILPLVEYRDLDHAIAYVNARPRPLALYYFDTDARSIARVLHETIAGGVTINDTLLHIAQDELPFGGVGPSGMGHYHGREGFETFSKKKSVFFQSRINGLGLFSPPYGTKFESLMRLLLR